MAVRNVVAPDTIAVNAGPYQAVVKVGFWQTDAGRGVINFGLATLGFMATNAVALAENNRFELEQVLNGPFGQYSALVVTLIIGFLVFLRSRYADKTTPRVERLSQ